MKNYIFIYFLMMTPFLLLSQLTIADFENLDLEDSEFLDGSDLAGGFASGNIFLHNEYTTEYSSWTGWAISSTTDTTTPGFANQYSCISGEGMGNSQNYAVAYLGFGESIIRLENEASGGIVDGMYINNSTYAYLSMLNGDAFAKKFGGETGEDPDFFLLTVKKYKEGEISQDSVNFYLADYRFEDNSQDYIIDEWIYLDLSVLGNCDSLSFSLSSTDNGVFGMNTPAYFCMDNLKTRDEMTSVQDIELNQVKIFPNPVIDFLNLETQLQETVNWKIIDMNGEVQKKSTLTIGNDIIEVNDLFPGLYMLSLEGKNEVRNVKFIKI